MKKLLSIALVLMLVLSLAACGGNQKKEEAPAEEPAEETVEEPAEEAEEPAEEATEEETEEATEEPAEEATEEPAAGGNKLGFGHAFETKVKEATEDEDGQFEGDAYVVALLIGEDGKALDCFIDIAQCKLDVTAEGEVVDVEKTFKTKRELGDEYGMAKASGLEKGEWYQQADALEEWVIGKTKDEVAGMGIDESGKSTDADLLAGCTVGHMPVFVEAITNAFDNTMDAGDATKVGVGVMTSAKNSKSETEEEEGQVQFYSYFGTTATNDAGVITACDIDAVQLTAKIADKAIVAPTEIKTKNELKEEYGMQKASSLEEGEWYQQAAFFANYMVGKDKAGLAGIELDDSDKATDPDLLAGCTIGHLSDIITAVVAGMQ